MTETFTEHANDHPELLKQYGIAPGDAVTNGEGDRCVAISGSGKMGEYPSIRYRKDRGGDKHYCTPSTWRLWAGK